MIFDDVIRDYQGTARHRENEYAFLNRSARPAAGRVRHLIEEWSNDYPDAERVHIRARLRSDFHSTFFEMFIYTLLRRLGCRVDIHPEINRERKSRPDFLATFSSGEKVIVECVYPTGRSGSVESSIARLNALYDEINQIRSPGFSLYVNEVSGLELRQPSTRRLRTFIQETLNHFDADELRARLLADGFSSMPTYVYRDGEFGLEFSVCAVAPELRKNDSDLIGVYPGGTRWGGYEAVLKATIAHKATKYGEMEYPFIVAVNTGSLYGPSQQDEMCAMFGDLSRSEQSEYTIPTKGNGVWVGLGGPQNTRLSGVLFGQVFPWKLPLAPLRLYHNPFAGRPCQNLPWRITQVLPRDGRMQLKEGDTTGSLLGLAPEWPGSLFGRDPDWDAETSGVAGDAAG
jgi:hypothetical protein